MKNIKIAVFFLCLFTVSCMPEKKVKPHLNIILSPDLSNRINKKVHKNKTIHDIDLIANILDNYYHDSKGKEKGKIYENDIFHSNKRFVNQRDKIRVRFTNETSINVYNVQAEKLKLDLSDNYFQNSSKKRVQYLQNKDTVKSFTKDKEEFLKELGSVYEKAISKTYGADLYGLIQNRLDNYIDTDTIQPYRNILVLFTDGYIESGAYKSFKTNDNKKTYLDHGTIQNFRKLYNKAKEQNPSLTSNAFFKKNNYGIVPIKNELLENLEILAFEFYDRSKDKGGGQTVQPDDYEILKLFWEDWLTQSGVKYFEIHKCVDNIDDFEAILGKFIDKNLKL